MADLLETPALPWRANGLPKTLAARTRSVYDRLATVYPVPTFLFHSQAHRCALDLAGIRDGMRVLEVATGSGEMFRRLVGANRGGATVGIDISPKMAARTHRRIRRKFPQARTLCQAVDARQMPFRDETFDAVVSCYLLELLCLEDILRALGEFRRVLRRKGKLTLVCIGQDTRLFNHIYKVAGGLAPAFWGRQVEHYLPPLLETAEFRVVAERTLRQSFYPSHVVLARRA
ncbi:MAG: methyltransferase domain-containing protein [Acidobacteriota bacterium]